MNKIFNFLGTEEKVLNGGKRYIPRLYNYNTHIKLEYCSQEFFVMKGNNGRPSITSPFYNEEVALQVYAYLVTNAISTPGFTIPDDVAGAIKTLHATDKKTKVFPAEQVLWDWFQAIPEQITPKNDICLGFYDYNFPYLDDLVQNHGVFQTQPQPQAAAPASDDDETHLMSFTTHLTRAMYSKRWGKFALRDGAKVLPGLCVYNNGYWPAKNPAPGINIQEQKISNFLLLDDSVEVNCNTATSIAGWSVTFTSEPGEITKAVLRTTNPSLEELDGKRMVLEAACALDYSRVQPFGSDRHEGLIRAAYACDRFYYECVKQASDSWVAKDEVEVEVILCSSISSQDDEEQASAGVNDVSDIGLEITLTAEGARNGEYDLNKMFDITFDKPAPDRAFLKNVAITKQHLSFCNKVIQSVYRIKRRKDAGITDLGQLIGADFVNVNFIGEPGTGKSFGLKVVAAILGVPLYIETFSGDSDTDKFQGTNSIEKGAPTFVWTAVPTAHKSGGFCALEEVNQMRPDKTMAMSQALVDPFLLKVDNTLDVFRNPYTFYINLFNVGTEGSKPFNEAYINRFGFTYDFCEDTEEVEKKQLRLMLGYETDNQDELDNITFSPRHLNDKDFEMAVTLKNRVVNYLTGDTVARDEEAKTISKRTCKEFLSEVQNGLDAESAAMGTFINTLKCLDRELAEEVKENVLDVFPFGNYIS